MIAAIPLGWLADFCPRVRLIWILSLAWSFGALAACISDGFWQICICCILIGASIACVNPVAFSLLSDYFPPENRAFVISAFSAVIFIGYDAGLATGFIAQYLTWRWAFALLGFPGFFIFLPALLMREPVRGLSEQSNDDFAMVSLFSLPFLLFIPLFLPSPFPCPFFILLLSLSPPLSSPSFVFLLFRSFQCHLLSLPFHLQSSSSICLFLLPPSLLLSFPLFILLRILPLSFFPSLYSSFVSFPYPSFPSPFPLPFFSPSLLLSFPYPSFLPLIHPS